MTEYHNAVMAVIRTQPEYSAAARRLARVPSDDRWTVNPWAVMTAIFLGWELAHILGAL